MRENSVQKHPWIDLDLARQLKRYCAPTERSCHCAFPCADAYI